MEKYFSCLHLYHKKFFSKNHKVWVVKEVHKERVVLQSAFWPWLQIYISIMKYYSLQIKHSWYVDLNPLTLIKLALRKGAMQGCSERHPALKVLVNVHQSFSRAVADVLGSGNCDSWVHTFTYCAWESGVSEPAMLQTAILRDKHCLLLHLCVTHHKVVLVYKKWS